MYNGIPLFSFGTKIVGVDVNQVIASKKTAKEFAAHFGEGIWWRPLSREEKALRDKVVAELEEREKKMGEDYVC